jgi:hypothetical protein
LTSSGRSSSFELVTNLVFGWSFGYISYVCRNGQWLMHRNAAQITGFTTPLCGRNHTQSGWNRPKSYCSKPCSVNSEDLGVEWAAEDICTSHLAMAKERSIYMVTKCRSSCLWLPWWADWKYV